MSKFEASISVKLDKSSISGLATSIQDALKGKQISLSGLKVEAGSVDVSGLVNSIKQKVQNELKNININASINGGGSGGGTGGGSNGSGSGGAVADYSKAAANLNAQIQNLLRTNSGFFSTSKGFDVKTGLEGASATLKAYGDDFKDISKDTVGSVAKDVALLKSQLSEVKLAGTPTETSLKNLAAQYRIFTKNANAYYKNNKAEIDETLRVLDAGGKDAQENASQYTERLAQMRNEAKALNQEGQSFLTMLGQQFTTFTKYTIVAEIFMKARQALQDMVQAVKEVDAAMTELKKVTDLSDSGYTQALEQAKSTAKEVGATLGDTVNATADFARLGYNVGDAAELARVALIYKNVGDGIEDVSQASESIISTMKAFGIAAEDAINIVDKFNNVGNNFAISSTGIGEALKRSAAALAAGGNTIDESIALITAANNVVQNPDAVGTAMKTYSMYLRAAKAEAEAAGESTEGMANSVSKLRDELMTLTGGRVDIMENDTTFKSTYQVTEELANIWDTVSDIDRAAILEKIGGKRNANTLSGLITNFAEAEKVLETSLNSAGSAVQENEKYLDSIAGKTAQLKAAFEDLSTSFLSSDLFKGIIDGGTKLIEVFDFIIDKIGMLGTVITGIGIAKAISGIVPVIQKLGGIKETISLLTSDIATSKLTGNALLSGIGSSFSVAAVGIGAVATVISAVTTAIKNSNEEIAKRASEASNAAKEYQQIADSIEEYKQKITEIREELNAPGVSEDMAQGKRAELVEIEAQLVEMFGQEAAALDLINGSVSDQISLIDGLQGKGFNAFYDENKKAIDRSVDLFTNISNIKDTESELNGVFKGFYSDGLLSLPSVKYYMDQVAETGVGVRVFQNAVNKELEKRFGAQTSKMGTAMFESGDWKQNNTGGNTDYLFGVSDITQMRDYVISAMEAVRTAGKKTFGAGYDKYLNGTLGEYSEVLNKINSIIGDNEDTFKTYAEGMLSTEYKDQWSQLLTARKEYDDAILSGDNAAIESSYRVMEKTKSSLEDYFKDVDDSAVKKYLEDYFSDFEDQEISIGAKIDIKDDLSKDGSQIRSAIEGSLKTFLDADGAINESLLNNSKKLFESGGASEAATMYEKLAEAADHYGLEVEQLISILKELGIVHESALTEAYKNASTDFADITNSLKRSFIEIGESGTGDFSGVTDDVERLKLVFYELADAYGYGSGELAKNIDNAGSFASFVSSAYSAIESQAESVATAMETVNAAMEEQASAGTVSLETFEKLADLGDAYTNILEWNGQGLAVNREAVENLNEALREGTRLEAESMQAASIDAWKNNIAVIAQMSASYSTLSESRRADLDSLIQYNAELLKSINGFQILMSQMDFENSGYKKWLDSANQTDTDKMYSDAVNAYQATQQVFGYTDKSSGKWVEGNRKINSLSFNAATEFLVPENIRKQGLNATQKYLNDIKKYMQDDQESVKEFLKAAEGEGLMTEENGVWSVNAGKTTEDFTENLNITKDLLTSLVGDANVYGVEFKFDDENQILALNDMQDYYETLNEYNKANADYNSKITRTVDENGNIIEEQTEESKAAKKRIDELNQQLADKEKELSGYDEETLKNIGVKFEEGQTKEEAIKDFLKGPDTELEVDVQYVEKNPKVGIQQKIQEYREAYAAMANDPNNLEAINKVEQLGTELSNLPTEVKTAFNIDTSLFEYGIASISETLNDLVHAGEDYQLRISAGESTEEVEKEIQSIVDSLNKLPEDKLIKLGFTTENGLLNEDGSINTDNLLKGLGDGTITLDSFNLDFGNTDTSGIEGTLATLEQIQSKVEEIRGMGDLIVVADIFIDEAMARVGDLKLKLDELNGAHPMVSLTLSAPNVLFVLGEIGSLLNDLTGSEHNATITATVIQAAMALQGIIGQLTSIEAPHSTTVSADTAGAVSAIDSVQSALDNLRDKTVTVTVNTIEKGATKVNGSAFAGGSWGVKRGGVSLVGELGRKVLRLRTEMCVIKTFI